MKQFIDGIVDLKAIIVRPGSVITKPGINVYVFGDLEGQADLLLNALIELKIVGMPAGDDLRDGRLSWIADDNTYVVQCGDQVDPGKRWATTKPDRTPELDIDALILTAYLAKVSGDRFINLIGNHEWENVIDKHDGCSGKGSECKTDPADKTRAELFGFEGIVGKILRQRHLMFKINHVLFTHAGLCTEVVEALLPGATGGVKEIISATTAFLDDHNNWGPKEEDAISSADYRLFFDSRAKPNPPEGGSDEGGSAGFSIMFNREYVVNSTRFTPGRGLIPTPLNSEINMQVIGHNKSTDADTSKVTMQYIKRDSGAAMQFVTNVEEGAQLKIPPSSECVIMADALLPRDPMIMPYMVMTFATELELECQFGSVGCDGGSCVSFGKVLGNVLPRKPRDEEQHVNVNMDDAF